MMDLMFFSDADDRAGIDIFSAIKVGDIDAVKAYIDGKGSLEACHHQHWKETPLGFAAYVGNVEAVEMLIASGAEVNACDKDGETCLLLAMRNASEKDDASIVRIVEMLVAAGADPYVSRRDGLDAVGGANNINDQELRHAVCAVLLPPQETSLQVVFNRQAGNMQLQEVYLFDQMERITYARTAGGQAMFREQFSAIAASPALRDAYDEHVKRGGTVTEGEVFGNGFGFFKPDMNR